MTDELNRFDRSPPGGGSFDTLWQCTRCGVFHWEKLRAEACCDKKLCERCDAKPRATGQIYCMECLHIRAAERLKSKLDAAEEVLPEMPVTEDGERWWNDVDDYIDWCVGEEVEPDQYLFASKKTIFSIDGVRVIEDALEGVFEHCEEAASDQKLNGEKEFLEAVDKFVQANQHVYTHEIDYTKKVKVMDLPETE